MRMTCNDVIPSFRSLSVDIIGHVLVASLDVQIVQVDVITSATLLALHVPLISLDILSRILVAMNIIMNLGGTKRR